MRKRVQTATAAGLLACATGLAGCTGSGPDAAPTTTPVAAMASSAAPSPSAAPTTTAGPVNRTGEVTIPDVLGGACEAFSLPMARQVVPDLPEQTMDLGDGNCSYVDPPDASNRADNVTFVRPHLGRPGWAADAQSGAGQVTPVAVGDGGFCADEGGGAFVLGWQRGSTGLELDALGPSVTCAELTSVAVFLNASL
jgi:hypothetical protein